MTNQLTITLPQRAFDGLVEAAIRNNRGTEDLATEILAHNGFRYADLFRIGVLTSAAFVARFMAAEYGAILAAAAVEPSVGQLVSELTSSPYVALDDPRLEPGLNQLVAAGLLAAERVSEILFYPRPVPDGTPYGWTPPPERPVALTVGQTWTDGSGQEWTVAQATNPDGTFAADDPETPERESLVWVQVNGGFDE